MSSSSPLLASACSGNHEGVDGGGTAIRRTIQMPGVGERAYHVYIPPSLCGAGDSGSDQHARIMPDDTDTVPLIFALHCLGCTAQSMMHLTSSIADPYHSVMVIPEGIQSSWNAGKYCCGYALSNQIDDVGFLNEIAAALEADLDGLISRTAMYGVGWSNAGYMATYAKSMFRAIAPISGHIYNVEQDIAPPVVSSELSTRTTTGIFMHHSRNDQFVQMTGCCTDPNMPHCCCGISENSPDTCTSAEAVLHSWATTINGCDGDKSNTTISYEDSNMGVSCQTIQGEGCQANSTICIHSMEGHFNQPSFETSFRMQEEVGAFFARDACSINGGTWSTADRYCNCGIGASGNGRYCLSTGMGGSHDSDTTPPLLLFSILIVCLALLPAIAWQWIKRLRLNIYQKAKDESPRRNDVEMCPLVA